jgi:TonB family protein
MNRLPRLQINARQFIFFLPCVLLCFLSLLNLIACQKFVTSASAIAPNSIKIAFLKVGESDHSFSAQFAQALHQSQKNLELLDESQSLSAARGTNNKNLLNLSLDEAKNLGDAIDCDFFFVIKSETIRRSSFAKDFYFESYAIVFLVSARSGRLIGWRDAHFEADTPEGAQKMLLANSRQLATNFADKLFAAAESEKNERRQITASRLRPIELSDAKTAIEQNYRIPLPYKNLRPLYTEAARRLEIEATVDVAVDLNEDGEVTQTEIIRWAGFDLDEETVKTVGSMHFRPALHNGKPLAVRFLLRYNFHDLSRKDEEQ